MPIRASVLTASALAIMGAINNGFQNARRLATIQDVKWEFHPYHYKEWKHLRDYFAPKGDENGKR